MLVEEPATGNGELRALSQALKASVNPLCEIAARNSCTSIEHRTSNTHDSLRKIAVIDGPEPKGQRFDYVTIDAEDRYLLSGHLGPGILYVVDMRTNKLVKAIPWLPGITGLEYVPDCTRYTPPTGAKRRSALSTFERCQ
jgi:hypothetical protein